MKQWQKHRIVAVLLVIATLMGMVPFATATYADNGASVQTDEEDTYGGRTLDEILELIEGKTYNEYLGTHSDKTAASDSSEILANAVDVLVKPGEKTSRPARTGRRRSTRMISLTRTKTELPTRVSTRRQRVK